MTKLCDLMQPCRFRGGMRFRNFVFSPRLSQGDRQALEQWLRTLPAAICERLPEIRISAAPLSEAFEDDCIHAGSFIPQGCLLLGDQLFSTRTELGRIVFHEVCHFLWPRLRRGRAVYEAAILRESRNGNSGELGFSAAASREWAPARIEDPGRLDATDLRHWRHYLCESFCDTGAYVLLKRSGYSLGRHPEWTLPKRARAHREAAWMGAAGLLPGVNGNQS